MSGEISTGDVAGVGIAIGPGARATVQVLGDLHYYPVTLRAPLREALRTLLDDSTRVFAGREEPLLEIAEFLRRPEGGYLAITAPAGFGKTALAAALARSAEERLAYHFFTPLYGESSLSEEFFLRSLVEQLAGWYGHAEEVPADIFELRALYQRFLARPLDRPGAILIDGLDEVSDWLLAPYLPRQLGAGLHVVVTVRDVGQDWAADFGLQHAAELPLHGLTRAQVAAVLAAAGADAGLADDVIRVAGTHGRADPFHVRLLAEDAAAGLEIRASASGLDRYLDEWWQAVRRVNRADATQDLFGTLTVALGPIGRAELERLHPSLVDAFEVDAFSAVIGAVRRFVVGDDDDGYALVHPRLREYMRKRIRTEPYEHQLLDFCRRWHEHGAPYALRHLVGHLAERGHVEELQHVVLSDAWAVASSVEGYTRDVRRVWRLSEGDVSIETRCALALASVNSLADTVPPALAGALVEAGDWTIERALTYARHVTDPGRRAETFVALLDHADDERTLFAALRAAEAAVQPHTDSMYMNAPDPWVQGRFGVRIFAPPREPGFRALAALEPYFDGLETVLEDALDAWDEHWTHTGDPQPGALACLAPVLGPELLEYALEIVREHTDPETVPKAWSGLETAACFAVLAAYLPVAQEAVDAAVREARLSGFTAVMPLVGDDRLDAFIQEGLEAALERDHQAWYRGLMAMDPRAGPFEGYVTDEDRVAWIAAVAARAPERAPALHGCLESPAHLAWAQGRFEEALDLGGGRTELLGALAAALPVALIERWLVLLPASRPECGDVDRARAGALAALVPRVPEGLFGKLLETIAALRIPAPALQALAPRLPPELLAQAEHIATGALKNHAARAKALAALGEPRRAVAVALQDPEWWRDDALFDAIAPELDADRLERALVQAARDPVVARRLEAWMDRVEPGDVAAALRAVHEVADAGTRAAALATLAEHLPPERLAEGLAEARGLPGPARVTASVPVLLRLAPEQQPAVTQEIATLLHEVEAYDGAWLRALARFAAVLPEFEAESWVDAALRLIDQFPPADRDALAALELLAGGVRVGGVIERVGRFNDYRQSVVLAKLAERDPDGALERALEIANPWYRARALPVRADQFDTALATLVEAAPDDWGDIEMFGDPGSYAFLARFVALEPERAGDVLDVMAEHLGEIQVEAALLTLAPALPPRWLDAAVELARRNEAWRAVGVLAARLPGPRRDNAIAHARAHSGGWGRIELAAAASPSVLLELVSEHIDELADGFRESVAGPLDGLEAVLPTLPPDTIEAIWTTVLRKLAARDRAALLADIAWFAPALQALGCAADVAAAVEAC